MAAMLVGVHGVAAAQPPRPTIDAESVLTLGALNAKPPSEQEPIIVALIADTPDSEVEEKSDYLFRLAELYSAQTRAFGSKEPQKTKATLIQAVKYWKLLVDTDAFRNYPKMDIALLE